MELLNALLQALLNLLTALYEVVTALLAAVAPLLPLLVWVAFWTLAVDWVRLRHFFLRGGWVALVLLMFVTILVWGVVAPPESGAHNMLGLTVSNFVGKAVYVTAIVVITFLCGSVQLSGVCGNLARFEDEQPEPGVHPH
jgi:hypothetical protein